jgi:formylglycine-generating enzyme required for sulfatase activity
MACNNNLKWGLIASAVVTAACLTPRPGLADGPAETVENSIGMKLVHIPAGDFEMGASEKPSALLEWAKDVAPSFKWELKHFAPESPQHRVRITKPFYIGAYEVTKDQFGKFVAATNYRTDAEKDGKGGFGYGTTFKPGATSGTIGFAQKPKYSWRGWGSDQGADHPVVNVSWNDAMAFCDWLSRKEGKTYRLPTEAEWEYACRAGTNTRFYNGDDTKELVRIGNLRDQATQKKFNWWKDSLKQSDGYAFTSPVGHFQPNALGLYDMLGNAAEWCADRYGADYYQHSSADDPKGPDSGSARVIRGGSWLGVPVDCNSTYRDSDDPASRCANVGFRVAREV